MTSDLQSRPRAPRNRTLVLSPDQESEIKGHLLHLRSVANLEDILDRTIHGNSFSVASLLPPSFADVVILDPPYNLDKSFGSIRFAACGLEEYEQWLESWLPSMLRLAKPTATVYICGDWRSSTAIHRVAEKHLTVRNRITWEREKGRGAKSNWKNCSEDIWFCTLSETFRFHTDAVKLRRRVIAPYVTSSGAPKDWRIENGSGFRDTHPSNLWSDITIPFWSMKENTDHPTQKPEKLIAKLLLASSSEGDVIFDPFLGSGTTSVVAKKLNRKFVGIELDEAHCCIAELRLARAFPGSSIQGYLDGVFWERNSCPANSDDDIRQPTAQPQLFRVDVD